MKHAIRSFSIGLLTSAVIILVVFYLIGNPVQSAEDIDPEQMIPLIEKKGYTVLSQEEYISLSVNKATIQEEDKPDDNVSGEKTEEEDSDVKTVEEQDNKTSPEETENKPEEKDEPAEEASEKSPVSYTLTINPGMASSDISSLLSENNIIENASEFNNYLDEHGYSLKVQIGSFDLTSDMSFYQLAERISN
ncbi:hypothetical protein [Oceanobacillus saliphilus]|uniref:hypothetical protein n=1 Tax=Oceanobacillus saliphilus TaxID=2925834 RepID=UPI00201D4C14|nr:hypothetical protein [Oceanobacillus saliphilus]